MDKLNLNLFLNRVEIESKLINILNHFQENKNDVLVKRGIYIYGAPGSGKSFFVKNILKKLNYDGIFYDAGDIRNKSIIETITKHNMSDKNILSLFSKKIKHIAIVMDEIDGMNSGDKGGINSLIKLIRPKKTKKQKNEEITLNPIISIGNYHVDKKIKELMKVSHVINLETPTDAQIQKLIEKLMPSISEEFSDDIIEYVEGDLRKLKNIYDIYESKHNVLKSEIIQKLLKKKSYNDDTKEILSSLIENPVSIKDHLTIMNETDRTIVALLWHENIIDVFNKKVNNKDINFYYKVLNNICDSDYIDRITFQKQIWQFNEMSSLIKTFYNNHIYHNEYSKKVKINQPRFTKVLTKYSTEYNNYTFIQNLCQKFSIEKKDLLSMFSNIQTKNLDESELIELFENYDVSILDVKRIFRYINNIMGLEIDN